MKKGGGCRTVKYLKSGLRKGPIGGRKAGGQPAAFFLPPPPPPQSGFEERSNEAWPPRLRCLLLPDPSIPEPQHASEGSWPWHRIHVFSSKPHDSWSWAFGGVKRRSQGSMNEKFQNCPKSIPGSEKQFFGWWTSSELRTPPNVWRRGGLGGGGLGGSEKGPCDCVVVWMVDVLPNVERRLSTSKKL